VAATPAENGDGGQDHHGPDHDDEADEADV